MLRKYHSFILIFVFGAFLIGITGCDKIQAFLGDYFPSLKQAEKTKASTSQIQTVQKQKKRTEKVNPLGPKDLARVGNWTLTIDEFKERMKNLAQIDPTIDPNKPEYQKIILEELIRQQLLLEDAEKSGLANSKKIRQAVEDVRRSLIVQEMISKLTEGVAPTDDEVLKYYNENKNKDPLFTEPVSWHVREIVVPTQQEANDILVELLKGADFAEMAKEHSKAKNAAKGGDLGFITEPPFPQMAAQLAVLDAGGLSGVFKGPDGFYIIKVEEKKGGKAKPFEEVRDQIKQGLTYLKQQQAVLNYIDKLKEKIPVEVNESLLAQ